MTWIKRGWEALPYYSFTYVTRFPRKKCLVYLSIFILHIPIGSILSVQEVTSIPMKRTYRDNGLWLLHQSVRNYSISTHTELFISRYNSIIVIKKYLFVLRNVRTLCYTTAPRLHNIVRVKPGRLLINISLIIIESEDVWNEPYGSDKNILSIPSSDIYKSVTAQSLPILKGWIIFTR